MKPLKFVNFDGLSFLSKSIKLWTRSKDSHTAVVDYEKGCLIEAWGSLLHVHWRYSDFSAHTPGTPYEVWELQVEDEQYERAMNFYRWLADRKFPYNYLGVIGFVFPFFTSNGGFFCSEGCWEGLVFAGVAPKNIPGWKVSPDRFKEQIELLGAHLVKKGKT